MDLGITQRPLSDISRAGDADGAQADLSETALIRRAQTGDHAAYAQLVRAHERLAFRTAYLIAGSADADEAAQAAFIKAYAALKRFTPGRPFRPWLLKIVVNEARTARRAAMRHQAIAARAVSAFDPSAAAASPSTEAVQAEEDEAVRAAIERLPAKQRDVVACRYLLELSEEETAATLGLRPGTVKSRLSRALDRLRAELEQIEDIAA